MSESNPEGSEEPDHGEEVDPASKGGSEDGYELEPEPDSSGPTRDLPTPAASEISEEPAADRRCERCGAPLPEDPAHTLCPSCGFDAGSGVVVDPPRSVEDSEDESVDQGEPESSPVLFAHGRPMPWLVAAGVVALLVSFAMLAGWSSFYPRLDGRFFDAAGDPVLDAPMVSLRLIAVAKYLVGSLVLVGTAAIAVRITCWFEEVRPGDLRSGIARLGLLVIVASLVRLIGFHPLFLQTMSQLLLGAGIVVGGAIFILGRRDRITAMFLIAWVLVVLLVIPVTRLVSWSLPLW